MNWNYSNYRLTATETTNLATNRQEHSPKPETNRKLTEKRQNHFSYQTQHDIMKILENRNDSWIQLFYIDYNRKMVRTNGIYKPCYHIHDNILINSNWICHQLTQNINNNNSLVFSSVMCLVFVFLIN